MTNTLVRRLAEPYEALVRSAPSRLRAEVADARRTATLWRRVPDHGQAHGSSYGFPEDGSANVLSEAAAMAVALAAERQQAAEVMALEWRLNDARLRHHEEIPHLDHYGEAVPVVRSPPPLAMRLRPAREAQVGGHIVGASPNGIGGGSSAPSVDCGPTLATCRRHLSGHAVRLWIEDCAASSSARVHAMDEASGARWHKDVADATLSAMLACYRHSQDEPGDTNDIDGFLSALLHAAYFAEPPHGEGLELQLPAYVVPLAAKKAEARFDMLDPNHSHDGASPSSMAAVGGGVGHAYSPPAHASPPCAFASSSTRRCVSSAGASLQVEQASPWVSPAPDLRRPPAQAVPCLQRGGPGSFGCGPGVRPDSAPIASAAPARSVPCTVAQVPQQAGCPRVCHRVDEPLEGEEDCVLLCAAYGRPRFASIEVPFVVPARPSSRPPLRVSGPGNGCGRPAHRRVRPQSAPHGTARRPHAVHCSGRGQADGVRRSRVRPSSAKALKHRRVVDDGMDCIIYEDVEEEAEEHKEQVEHWENPQEASGPGAGASVVAEPDGEAASEVGITELRSSTGGCGSRSSSLPGSDPSRSVSRSRDTSSPAGCSRTFKPCDGEECLIPQEAGSMVETLPSAPESPAPQLRTPEDALGVPMPAEGVLAAACPEAAAAAEAPPPPASQPRPPEGRPTTQRPRPRASPTSGVPDDTVQPAVPLPHEVTELGPMAAAGAALGRGPRASSPPRRGRPIMGPLV